MFRRENLIMVSIVQAERLEKGEYQLERVAGLVPGPPHDFRQVVVVQAYLAKEYVSSGHERLADLGRVVVLRYRTFTVTDKDPSGAIFHDHPPLDSDDAGPSAAPFHCSTHFSRKALSG